VSVCNILGLITIFLRLSFFSPLFLTLNSNFFVILELITILLGLNFFPPFLALNSIFCETRLLMRVKVKGEQTDFEIFLFFPIFGILGFWNFSTFGIFWHYSGYFVIF